MRPRCPPEQEASGRTADYDTGGVAASLAKDNPVTKQQPGVHWGAAMPPARAEYCCEKLRAGARHDLKTAEAAAALDASQLSSSSSKSHS
jgi:hypothetical protein